MRYEQKIYFDDEQLRLYRTLFSLLPCKEKKLSRICVWLRQQRSLVSPGCSKSALRKRAAEVSSWVKYQIQMQRQENLRYVDVASA
jgi:hypothetical protein